ncbi:tumor necrosis factor receptor superfamily member 18 isoform X2 [Elephas maximus indicus]|uniref:tumor necrosis factor receptor superfamily member 18 isoform X2 n=1 Tax=Elephas maximus indicus TaxID=99487 RepID=UPI002116B8CC|nr:tumor necrosis factor receptor superfamily member 18 isoform X2 [Elephas maximus indicus]
MPTRPGSTTPRPVTSEISVEWMTRRGQLFCCGPQPQGHTQLNNPTSFTQHPLQPVCLSPGKFTFGFECVDCAPGTFSEGRDGRCKPRADCSRLGFPTVFPGNRTHNAVCGLGPPTESWHPLTLALLAVATCILVLVTVQLGLHIWKLRSARTWHRGTQRPREVPMAEDTCSYQFPEEERGERLAEEKGRLGDLRV